MKKVLDEFFSIEKIEYFGVLPYSLCKETNSAIMKRESFTPKSAIVYLVPYYSGETENISRYAAAKDYHICISEINSRLAAALKNEFPGSSQKGYGDHSPIDERLAAANLGLGIFGDNGLLINEKYGSYVFIADLVTDIMPEHLGELRFFEPRHCESCGACRAACPTGILRGEGEECLSAITQKKGELRESDVRLMKEYNTVWGCDLCQSSCPHNSDPEKSPISFFSEDLIPRLDIDILESLSDAEFSERAFAWRKKKTVERNLLALYGKSE